MLHRVIPPACQPELRKLVRFQKKVLRFGLNASLPLTPEVFQDFFGMKTGNWLWERVYTKDKKTEKDVLTKKFGENLNKLVEYAESDRGEIKKIFRVFRNDIYFFIRWNVPDFQFQFPTLSKEWQAVLKPFLKSFYELLDSPGFRQEVFGWGPDDLTRKKLVQHYREAGNKVCP